jgi:ferredoxin-NADP reductase
MNPPKHFVAKLADKIQLNEKFVQYKFELVEPSVMEFSAGQYVSIAVGDEGHRRSYSICSSPADNHGFELMVDETPNGIGVQYLHGLQFGQELKMLAPMGMFTVGNESETSPLIFVATGSGVTPFRSMLFDQLQIKKNPRPMILYWGMRHVEDLFWEDEFEELAENFPHFQFHPVMSQGNDQWPLCRGHVTDCLDIHEQLPSAHYYICGNARMLADVIQLLEKKGVGKEQIHHEKFY